MSHRPRLPDVAPQAYAALRGVEAAIAASGLDRRLIELIKLRASQINGCAFCLDMHARDARALGESAQRLDVLAGWRETPCFDARERAALDWTERLTRVATDGPPGAASEALSGLFSDAEIVHLTLLVGMINLWNRIAIGLGMQPAVAA